jgi:glycosyltransferase involved in cell wall biosynthesis
MVQVGEYPVLSIVIPVRNMAHTIRTLLDSLMRLDYDSNKLEILFIDGNSTDGTRDVVKKYPVKLVQQEGEGLNAARNTGIKHSTGEIIAYTDGDCVVPRDWAKNIVQNFWDPSVAFVGGTMEGYHKHDPFSNYMDETFFQVTPGFSIRIETTDLHLMEFPAGANMAFRRRALERVRFFDESINYGFDDLQPVEEMSFKGFRIVLDPEVNIYHRHRSSLKDLLKQHFNYGRGGTLLVIKKRGSLLAHWFASYLIFTTAFLSVFSFLMYLGLILRRGLPLQIGLGSVGFLMFIELIYYIPISLKEFKLWKLVTYPVLDLLRGLAFTFGGLYQLVKSLSQKVIP